MIKILKLHIIKWLSRTIVWLAWPEFVVHVQITDEDRLEEQFKQYIEDSLSVPKVEKKVEA